MSPVHCVQHLCTTGAIYRPTTHSTGGAGTLTNPTYGYDSSTSTYSNQNVASSGTVLRSHTTTYSGWAPGTRSGRLVIRRDAGAYVAFDGYGSATVTIHVSTDGGSTWTTLETVTPATSFLPPELTTTLTSVTMQNLQVKVTTSAKGEYTEWGEYSDGFASITIYDIRFEE